MWKMSNVPITGLKQKPDHRYTLEARRFSLRSLEEAINGSAVSLHVCQCKCKVWRISEAHRVKCISLCWRLLRNVRFLPSVSAYRHFLIGLCVWSQCEGKYVNTMDQISWNYTWSRYIGSGNSKGVCSQIKTMCDIVWLTAQRASSKREKVFSGTIKMIGEGWVGALYYPPCRISLY